MSGHIFGPIGYVLNCKSTILQIKILLLFIKYGIDMTKEMVSEYDDFIDSRYTIDEYSLLNYCNRYEKNPHQNFVLYLIIFSAKQN